MKKYHNIDNKKLMLKLEKPHLLHLFSNNKFHYKVNSHNNPQNKFSHNTSFSPLLKGKNNKASNTNIFNNFPNQKKNNSPSKAKSNYIKDNINNIIKTTPLKFQYKKIPFEKVKGFKLKLPNNLLNNKSNNNYKKNILNTHQTNYPIIYEHNNSTIESNISTIKEKSYKKSNNKLNKNLKNTIITDNNNTLGHKTEVINPNIIDTIQENNKLANINNNNINGNKKPLYHLIETKSSSIGSKLETREESGHFIKSRSKSSINSPQLFNNNINFIKNLNKKKFSFLKFDKINNNKIKISSKKKILKYLDKTIKQLTKIKTIILDEKDSEEEYKEDKYNEKNEEEINEEKEDNLNKYIKIDLLKIGKNLERYKNKIDIDKNTINISYEGNNNKQIYPYNYNGINKKGYKNTLKKLNKTITYEDLKSNIKEKQKLLQIEQKSFKNFKQFNFNKRNKSENNKFNTINTYTGDYFGYKGIFKNNDNNINYKIKNYDTEIKIPKLNIKFNNNKNNNENIILNKINEEDSYLNNDNNNKIKERYNIDNEMDNNADIANFEFSD